MHTTMNTGKVSRVSASAKAQSETINTPTSIVSRMLKAVVAAMLAVTMMPSAGLAFAAEDALGGGFTACKLF